MEVLGKVQDTAGLYEFARINSSFHKKIIEASGSILLTSLLSQLIDMPLVVLKEHSWRGRANQHRSNQQHRNIIDALKSHDPKWARSVMYGHIISTRPHPESKP
jgi:DNA-binding GntR family transcriptional regulator